MQKIKINGVNIKMPERRGLKGSGNLNQPNVVKIQFCRT